MKLGFFTDPFTDELLYSICARYSDRMNFSDKAVAKHALFGTKGTQMAIDLPNRIDHLISVLPPGHLYTSDYFIDEHTLAPLYFPFMPIERIEKLRNDMKRGNSLSAAHTRAGKTTSKFKPPQWLRYCPVCATEEQEKFGVNYWHRLHQISGVNVCPVHNTFLEETLTPWSYGKGNAKVTSANQAVIILTPQYINASNFYDKILLKLAKDVQWLLNWRGPYQGMEFLRDRYYNLLLKAGLAYYNGKIKTSTLSHEMESYFSSSLLTNLQSEIADFEKGWVYRLVHTNTFEILQHPIRHLLLITFLGLSAKEFFSNRETFLPFGEGPWPCLNKAANHYKQNVIENCRITDSPVKNKRERPQGIFTCECGFIYTRIGPDSDKSGCYKLNSISEYGGVWEDALAQYWKKIELPLSVVAEKLGVSSLSVVRHAIRLKLPMNQPGYRTVTGYKKHNNPRKPFTQSLEYYRKKWGELRVEHPNATRNELISLGSFTYLWLNKSDKEWLELHLPAVVKKDRKVPLLNWDELDNELSNSVEKAITQIRATTEKPIRVSLAEIVRYAGHRSHLEQAILKLPKTKSILENNLESLESYALRCIKWAEEFYLQNNISPSKSSFIVKAGLNNKTGKSLKIQTQLEEALRKIWSLLKK